MARGAWRMAPSRKEILDVCLRHHLCDFIGYAEVQDTIGIEVTSHIFIKAELALSVPNLVKMQIPFLCQQSVMFPLRHEIFEV